MIRPLLAAAVLCAGLGLAAPALAAKPEYKASPCVGDFGAAAPRASCGILTVDESRGTASWKVVSRRRCGSRPSCRSRAQSVSTA